MNDSDLRYGFTCPSCSGTFSISLAKIPPVQARFSCPKCGKAMDFPSREEARVYISLQASGAAAATDPPEPQQEASLRETPPPARPTPPPRPAAPPVPEPAAADSSAASHRVYRVQRKGFENDEYDRRAMRNLIRSGGLLESDSVSVDGNAPHRAADLPELKSLFDLRKSSRLSPPAVCRKHTDKVAHYVCADTERPLCEDCAEEKKFGGASVRVCDHCGGTVNELPVAEEG